MSTEYEQALKVGNGSNLVILIKFKDSGRGEIKTVKFSHFGAPNVSNLVILIKFKGSGQGGVKTKHYVQNKKTLIRPFYQISGLETGPIQLTFSQNHMNHEIWCI